jgi:hypothetical protein
MPPVTLMHAKCFTNLTVYELVIVIFKKYTNSSYAIFASLLLLPIPALISDLPCHNCTPSKRKFTPIENKRQNYCVF